MASTSFAIRFILLLLIAISLSLNVYLFGLTMGAFIAIILYIGYSRQDIIKRIHFPLQNWSQLCILPIIGFIIRLFIPAALTQYTVLFLPFAAESVFSFWENGPRGRTINFIFAFIPLAITFFILTLFISPHITFPYLLAAFTMCFILTFSHFRVFLNIAWKSSLLYFMTLLLFPVLYALLRNDLITAAILSGCFAYLLYLHHFMDEIKGIIFLFFGIVFYIAFQWSGFLAFILMTATTFYIAFIAHEFRLSFMNSDSSFYSLTTQLLSFEILPLLLAIGGIIFQREGLVFLFYACQAFILFRLLNEILGRTYSRYGYSIPAGKKLPITSPPAISLEGLLLSLSLTIVFLLILTLYSQLMNVKAVIFISFLGIIIYLTEKWTRNYSQHFSFWGYQFISLLLISLLSGFFLLF